MFDANPSESEGEQETEEEANVVSDSGNVQLGETPALATNNTLTHVETLCQNGFILQTAKVNSYLRLIKLDLKQGVIEGYFKLFRNG